MPADPTSDHPPVDELRRQQQAETSSSGLGTPGQWHGAIGGAILGGIVGAAIMFVIGLVAFGESTQITVLTLIGLGFGAAAGLVYQGGRNPEREQELLTAEGDPDPSTAVAGNPPSADEHG